MSTEATEGNTRIYYGREDYTVKIEKENNRLKG